ncbi:response regulator transcription factor [Fibrella sp. HMF5335]|uniref:Phosphate regulon transcriptional regulatory protein PhoB n=1 Tax=Fibrella rubiginis TaxID=2817060 RepID=A0A939K523_9BACT|nr:response regulator transcription factor [Fibrella rubiginis]MBO0937298.1 response regulator transcription factor [Fibrella rubiginis]
MQKRALVVEDDPDIANLVMVSLRDINVQADIIGNGADGLRHATSKPYDIIILDIMLPDLDGIEVCQRIRQQQITTPILMLTARSEEIDKVLAIDLGADDYMTKPFSVRELLSRVKARMRRFETDSAAGSLGLLPRYAYGELALDVGTRRVMLAGKAVDLTAKEFDLLTLFMKHPGRAFSRMELLELVWGYSYQGYEHTVNSHINRLRMKIEQEPAAPRYILTVWAVGYKFSEDVQR